MGRDPASRHFDAPGRCRSSWTRLTPPVSRCQVSASSAPYGPTASAYGMPCSVRSHVPARPRSYHSYTQVISMPSVLYHCTPLINTTPLKPSSQLAHSRAYRCKRTALLRVARTCRRVALQINCKHRTAVDHEAPAMRGGQKGENPHWSSSYRQPQAARTTPNDRGADEAGAVHAFGFRVRF